MVLSSLTNDELLSHLNSLPAMTQLERELARRLEQTLQEIDDLQAEIRELDS